MNKSVSKSHFNMRGSQQYYDQTANSETFPQKGQLKSQYEHMLQDYKNG